MASHTGGVADRRRARDSARSAYLRSSGKEVRTSGVCAVCYRTIAVDSARSRYTHVCKGH